MTMTRRLGRQVAQRPHRVERRQSRKYLSYLLLARHEQVDDSHEPRDLGRRRFAEAPAVEVDRYQTGGSRPQRVGKLGLKVQRQGREMAERERPCVQIRGLRAEIQPVPHARAKNEAPDAALLIRPQLRNVRSIGRQRLKSIWSASLSTG